MKSPRQGGDTVVHAALDPAVVSMKDPVYLENCRPARLSSFARDVSNQVYQGESGFHPLTPGTGPDVGPHPRDPRYPAVRAGQPVRRGRPVAILIDCTIFIIVQFISVAINN